MYIRAYRHWLGHFEVNFCGVHPPHHTHTHTRTHTHTHTHTHNTDEHTHIPHITQSEDRWMHTQRERSMYTELRGLTIKVVADSMCDTTSTCAYTPTKNQHKQKPTHCIMLHTRLRTEEHMYMYVYMYVCLFSPLHIFILIWAQSWV